MSFLIFMMGSPSVSTHSQGSLQLDGHTIAYYNKHNCNTESLLQQDKISDYCLKS